MDILWQPGKTGDSRMKADSETRSGICSQRKAERGMEMEVDLRRYTRCIVEKDGEYLIGLCGRPRWSKSPYDAWHTRTKENAIRVALKLGGRLMLFNPIAGQLAPLASICDERRSIAKSS